MKEKKDGKRWKLERKKYLETERGNCCILGSLKLYKGPLWTQKYAEKARESKDRESKRGRERVWDQERERAKDILWRSSLWVGPEYRAEAQFPLFDKHTKRRRERERERISFVHKIPLRLKILLHLSVRRVSVKVVASRRRRRCRRRRCLIFIVKKVFVWDFAKNNENPRSFRKSSILLSEPPTIYLRR